jgi:hypothetical protein
MNEHSSCSQLSRSGGGIGDRGRLQASTGPNPRLEPKGLNPMFAPDELEQLIKEIGGQLKEPFREDCLARLNPK